MSDNVLNEVSINSFSAELEVTDTVAQGEGGTVVLNGHSPYIGQNGNWYEYNDTTKQYVDTGVKAEGPAGPTGATGPQGPQGPAGSDYVLTTQDKNDIAALVVPLLPVYDGSVT